MHKHFTKEDTWVANKYTKRGSPSFLVQKFQIKDTIRYYHTPVNMAKKKKKKTDNGKS